MILIIDNYDSCTYNVCQFVASFGHTAKVMRNDAIAVREVELMACSAIIISPGPGTPDDAGISKVVIQAFAGRIPILGVCLGHQAIGEVFGGKVIRAPQPVHGKVSLIQHSASGIYEGLPQPFQAGRYHSLVVDRDSLPDCLEVTATSAEGLIMGLRHRKYNVEGVQLPPESILTPCGMQLLKNFLVKT